MGGCHSCLISRRLRGLDVVTNFNPKKDFHFHYHVAAQGLIRARVVDVYDGDTIRVQYFDKGFKRSLTQARLRFYGIDTPEIRGGDDEERRRAHAARQFVIEALQFDETMQRPCLIDFRAMPICLKQPDPYNRLISFVYPAGRAPTKMMMMTAFDFVENGNLLEFFHGSINGRILASGHARPFDPYGRLPDLLEDEKRLGGGQTPPLSDKQKKSYEAQAASFTEIYKDYSL